MLILGTLIWALLNLNLSKIETTGKYNTSFLIISVALYEHNNNKTNK